MSLQTPPSNKSAATREKIISAAEQLFAERGVVSVSLADINRHAGQRNRNATHYHFGSKEGLIQAILDKHNPGILAQREQMLAPLEMSDTLAARAVVQALMQPLVDKMFDASGGREFLCINAQLMVLHTRDAFRKDRAPAFAIGNNDALTEALRKVMHDLPLRLARQRGTLAAVLLVNALADHSRLMQQEGRSKINAESKFMLRALEDALVAILAAP